ncbi:hypothetical protein NE865_12923 [Phthorimaea operculella]|nr:hypothetical protein NE865_12923 [Phthorimaea operculella]
MGVIRKLLVVFLVCNALADELIHPCKKDDTVCLNDSAQSFLEKTSAGVPAYNLIAIDPFHADHFEHTFESGEKVTFKNVTVTGLKKLVVADFKIDTKTKNVNLLMENEPTIVTDIEVDGESSKISTKGKVHMFSEYKYDLVPNAEGVNYFTVGPETLRCDPQEVPEVSALSGAGADAWKAKSDEDKKKLICVLSKTAFQAVMHNLRESAKFNPSTTYFKDLD